MASTACEGEPTSLPLDSVVLAGFPCSASTLHRLLYLARHSRLILYDLLRICSDDRHIAVCVVVWAFRLVSPLFLSEQIYCQWVVPVTVYIMRSAITVNYLILGPGFCPSSYTLRRLFQTQAAFDVGIFVSMLLVWRPNAAVELIFCAVKALGLLVLCHWHCHRVPGGSNMAWQLAIWVMVPGATLGIIRQGEPRGRRRSTTGTAGSVVGGAAVATTTAAAARILPGDDPPAGVFGKVSAAAAPAAGAAVGCSGVERDAGAGRRGGSAGGGVNGAAPLQTGDPRDVAGPADLESRTGGMPPPSGTTSWTAAGSVLQKHGMEADLRQNALGGVAGDFSDDAAGGTNAVPVVAWRGSVDEFDGLGGRAGQPTVATAWAVASVLAQHQHQLLPSPPAELPPYKSLVRRRTLSYKIPWAEPEQLTPGYEQRLRELVATRGYRLAAVYVRRGCVDLTMVLEDAEPAPADASPAAGRQRVPQQPQRHRRPAAELDLMEVLRALGLLLPSQPAGAAAAAGDAGVMAVNEELTSRGGAAADEVSCSCGDSSDDPEEGRLQLLLSLVRQASLGDELEADAEADAGPGLEDGDVAANGGEVDTPPSEGSGGRGGARPRLLAAREASSPPRVLSAWPRVLLVPVTSRDNTAGGGPATAAAAAGSPAVAAAAGSGPGFGVGSSSVSSGDIDGNERVAVELRVVVAWQPPGATHGSAGEDGPMGQAAEQAQEAPSGGVGSPQRMRVDVHDGCGGRLPARLIDHGATSADTGGAASYKYDIQLLQPPARLGHLWVHLTRSARSGSGAPQRVVLPLLVVDDARVAAELAAAAAAGWRDSGAPELDGLLYDMGSWVAAATAAGSAAAAGRSSPTGTRSPSHTATPAADAFSSGAGAATDALHQTGSPAVKVLGEHLLLYAQAAGWAATTAWIAAKLEAAGDGAAAAAAATPGVGMDVAYDIEATAATALAGAGSGKTAAMASKSPEPESPCIQGKGARQGQSADEVPPAAAAAAEGPRRGKEPWLRRAWRWLQARALLVSEPRTSVESAALQSLKERWLVHMGLTFQLMESTLLFIVFSQELRSCGLSIRPRTLVACASLGPGPLLLAARLVLSYRTWERLVVRGRLVRLGCHLLGRLLLGSTMASTPPPVAANSYWGSSTWLRFILYEGMIMPAAFLLGPRAAALFAVASLPLNAKVLRGLAIAWSTGAAWRLSAAGSAVVLATSIACHAWLRSSAASVRRPVGPKEKLHPGAEGDGEVDRDPPSATATPANTTASPI